MSICQNKIKHHSSPDLLWWNPRQQTRNLHCRNPLRCKPLKIIQTCRHYWLRRYRGERIVSNVRFFSPTLESTKKQTANPEGLAIVDFQRAPAIKTLHSWGTARGAEPLEFFLSRLGSVNRSGSSTWLATTKEVQITGTRSTLEIIITTPTSPQTGSAFEVDGLLRQLVKLMD